MPFRSQILSIISLRTKLFPHIFFQFLEQNFGNIKSTTLLLKTHCAEAFQLDLCCFQMFVCSNITYETACINFTVKCV
jgi:hypothetical protein